MLRHHRGLSSCTCHSNTVVYGAIFLDHWFCKPVMFPAATQPSSQNFILLYFLIRCFSDSVFCAPLSFKSAPREMTSVGDKSGRVNTFSIL